jgi:hypothetical protein
MPEKNLPKEMEDIFSDTLKWYNEQKTKAKGIKDLVNILKREIDKIEETRKQCRDFFTKAAKAQDLRKKRRKEWKEGITDQEELLEDLLKSKPKPPTEQIFIDQAEQTISRATKMLAATKETGIALEKSWKEDDERSANHQESVINAVKLLVSLKINAGTFPRIAESIKVLAPLIPHAPIVLGLLAGSYDMFAVWKGRGKDMAKNRASMEWLQRRSEFLDDLSRVIRLSSWSL